LSDAHFAYAAELEFDGSGVSRIAGEDHNWHRIGWESLESDVDGDTNEQDEVDETLATQVQVRAAEPLIIAGNNAPNVDNILPGTTTIWRLPETQLLGRHAARGPGLPSDGRDAVEVAQSHAELRRRNSELEDDASELSARQEGRSRNIYVSINTCLQPLYSRSGVQEVAPPQLTLYVSTASSNANPGPGSNGEQAVVVLDEGYANYTTEATGDWYMAVHAPDRPDDFEGVWNYELAVSIDDYYHSLGVNGSNLFLVDSDSQAALLVTNNLTQADASSASYQAWMDLKAPFIIFGSKADNTRTMGIEKSYCGLNKASQIVGKQADLDGQNTNVQMQMITRGLGQKPKEQFFVTGLDRATRYQAILAQPGNSTDSGEGVVGGGGKVWRSVHFATKSDNNCALLFDLSFCDQVAYAVPSTPEAMSEIDSFNQFWDDYTLKYYQNFNYSLQQIPCKTTPDAQYSLARNCDDCAKAYKEWLCAVSIPRCEDFSNPAPYLQIRNVGQPFINGTTLSPAYLNSSFTPMHGAPTLEGSMAFQQTLGSSIATNHSRNFEIDRVIKPGPYKEVLPCEDLCYNLVQSCPAALGFMCPYPGRGLEVGYGTRAGLADGVTTCSYLGAYVYTDSATGIVPNLLLLCALGLAGVLYVGAL